MIKLKKIRFFLISLLCLFVFLLIAETILQLFSFFYKRSDSRLVSTDSSEKIILCLGESTTAFGLNDSYPSILQNLIDRKIGAHKYRVINQGVPGTSLAEVSWRLPQLIKRYHPNIIISMLGINDVLHFRQHGNRHSSIKILQVIYWLTDYIEDHISLLKFSDTDEQMISMGLDLEVPAPDRHAFSLYQQRQYAEASHELVEIIKTTAPSRVTFWLAAQSYLNAGDISKSLIYFRKFLNIGDRAANAVLIAWSLQYSTNISNQDILDFSTEILKPVSLASTAELQVKADYLLGRIYRQKKDYFTSSKYFSEADHLSPCESLVYYGMKSTLAESGTPDLVQNWNNHCSSLNKTFNYAASAAKFALTSEAIDSYKKISEIIAQNHIAHIVMQYPLLDTQKIQAYLAAYPDIVYISNEDNFRTQLSQHTYTELFTDRFAGLFGHATRLGNSVLAQNIFSTLEQKHLLY